MITAKQLKEDILTYDIIFEIDEEGNEVEFVEVTLVDRVLEVYMSTKEVNIGLIVKKILEDNLYE